MLKLKLSRKEKTFKKLSDEKLNIAYLGLGSNEGNRLNNIELSIELINELDGCDVEAVSSLYETSPYGNLEQQVFFNAVIKILTGLNPGELFSKLKEIENKIGRKNHRNFWRKNLNFGFQLDF